MSNEEFDTESQSRLVYQENYLSDKKELTDKIQTLISDFEKKYRVHLTSTSSDQEPRTWGDVAKGVPIRTINFRLDFGC